MYILQQLEQDLVAIGYDCSFELHSEVLTQDRLLIYLGADEKEREQILTITAIQQEMGDDLRETPPPPYYHLQYEIQLPIQVTDGAIPDLACTLFFINRRIELPAFELDEVERTVFFRNVQLIQEYHKEIVLGIIGLIQIYLKFYSECIEQIAIQSKTHTELLEEVLELANRSHPDE